MNKTFRALNGLRFIAALAVVCFHFVPLEGGFKSYPAVIQNLVYSGPIALGFFFILSGFVLAHAYCSRPPQTSEKRRGFWWARFARLYPVYLLAYVLFLPMAYEKYLHHPDPAIDGMRTFFAGGLLNLFAVQAWTPLAQSWNGPSWSLSVEAFFYFLFPFVMVPILGVSRKRMLLILALLWSMMLAFPLGHQLGLVPDGVWTRWIENNPLFWTPLFLFGIFLYRWSPAWSSMNGKRAAWSGVAALGALVLLCSLLPPSGRELFISGGAAPILGVIVLAYSHSTSWVSRAMGTRVLFKAGATSYITYILQSPIWHIFVLVSDKLRHGPSPHLLTVWHFALYVLVLLGISFTVQILFERPVQRWILARVSPRVALVPIDPGIEAA